VIRLPVGQKYGRITIIGEAPMGPNWTVFVVGQCDCGTIKQFRGWGLLRGSAKACGCGRKGIIRNSKHGDTSRDNGVTSEYGTWHSMLDRCSNPNNRKWKHYGGRGISVCPEWRKDYKAFLAHIGRRPSPDLSLDRIDPDGNYEPGNVRWTDSLTQRHNRTRRTQCRN